MKKSDIYEVTIKIVGIAATYMFLTSLISCIIIYMSFLSIQVHININPMGIFLSSINIMTFIPIVLYGLIAYLFLFKTDKIINVLRLSDSTEMTLQIEKKTFYHIVVLIIGFAMFTYSSCQLMSYTYYKPEVSTTQQTNQQMNQMNQMSQQMIQMNQMNQQMIQQMNQQMIQLMNQNRNQQITQQTTQQIPQQTTQQITQQTTQQIPQQTTQQTTFGQNPYVTINQPNVNSSTTTTKGPSTNVNFISIIILLLSILILIKSVKFSEILMPKE